jgi:hypothetical protein
VPVEVTVVEYAPEVASVELSARVSVAETAGAVKIILLIEVAEAEPISGIVKVIPAKVKAAEALFKATEVVPINIDELLGALSPVLLPLTEADPERVNAKAPAIERESVIVKVFPEVIASPWTPVVRAA